MGRIVPKAIAEPVRSSVRDAVSELRRSDIVSPAPAPRQAGAISSATISCNYIQGDFCDVSALRFDLIPAAGLGGTSVISWQLQLFSVTFSALIPRPNNYRCT